MNRVLIILLTFSFAAAAGADETHYKFAYSAADFTDLGSVERLHKRISRTARDFCPPYLPARHLAETRRCVAEVTRDIVRSIDHPALTAVAEGAPAEARLALQENEGQRDRRSRSRPNPS